MRIPSIATIPIILIGTLLFGSGSLGAAEKDVTSSAPETVQFAIPATDADIPGVGPIRRDGEFQRNWRELRSGWSGRREQDRRAVVFLGDSIIRRWGSGLEAAFPGIKVANRGIDNDTTRGVLLRLPQDVLALEPRAVVLLVGTSDLDAGATPEVAAFNLRLILSALEQRSPTMPIVVCQALPRSDPLAKSPDQIKALNTAYLEVAKDRPTVTYLETWAQMADAGGNATARDFADLLHLNEAGYQKLAAALRPVFSTIGILTEPSEQFTPDPGFVSLFNGRDLTGWGYRPTSQDEMEAAKRRDATNPRPPVRVYTERAVRFNGSTNSTEGRFLARNGRLVVTTPPEYRKIQQLWTEQEFPRDFVLKLEFRATPNADSGIYIRGPQLQVRDYLVAGPYNRLKHYRPQDWNTIEVTVTGGEAVCTCNGEVLEAHFKVPTTGPIGLEGDRGQVEYRRIQVRVLP